MQAETMTHHNSAQKQGGKIDGQLTDSAALFTALSRELAEALRAIALEAEAGRTGIEQRQAALTMALAQAKRMEALLDGRRERDGDSGAGPLDLDAVRDQIGCRLHRLRSCCKAG
ncbi:hypothetical protein AADZ90_017945 [Aestuariibius sp. 2305UL40-4]|uniref:hypothetical protein n=1 Tax=Aestuariibius violaceus TaxID=3234132 RepID=UPI00345EE17F